MSVHFDAVKLEKIRRGSLRHIIRWVGGTIKRQTGVIKDILYDTSVTGDTHYLTHSENSCAVGCVSNKTH